VSNCSAKGNAACCKLPDNATMVALVPGSCATWQCVEGTQRDGDKCVEAGVSVPLVSGVSLAALAVVAEAARRLSSFANFVPTPLNKRMPTPSHQINIKIH